MGKKSKSSSASSPLDGGAPAVAPCVVPLLAWMDERVNDLRDLVPRALRAWDEEAIHQARVNTRKLKAAIDLMAPVTSPDHRRAFGRVLRRLRRRLGPLRDLDVMIRHLKDLADAEGRPHAAAAGWMADKLAAQREELHAAASGKEVSAILSKIGAWWGLRQEVQDAGEAVDTLLAESVHLQLDAFAEQADRLTGVTPAQVDGEPPQDPHELRIAGKALRYTLDMAGVQGHPLPGGVGKAFKGMQEALGLWHDHVVLSESSLRLALDHLLVHHDTAMYLQVLGVAEWAAKAAASHMAQFTDLWKGQGAELAQTTRTAFPLTRPLPTGGAKKKEKKATPDEASVVPCDPPPAVQDEPAAPPVEGL
ncbi:MAG TPA: CHAD domain-containing protein, partial [Tepidisphaeraceae bacterium]|nr:CHAD domain-containing protein [Tepidisphaeraceae bacterium]